MKFNISLPSLKEHCDPEQSQICSCCGSTNTIRHSSQEARIIRDSKLKFIERQRRTCKDCSRTYTCHPQGVKKYYQRSSRLIFSGCLLYLAGLSFDKASGLLSALFQAEVGAKSTLWRDLQNIGGNLKLQKIFSKFRQANQPQIIGIDGAYIKIKGKEVCLEFVVDSSVETKEADSLLKVSIISSESSKEIYQLIQSLAKELDLSEVKLVVSDDGKGNHRAVELLNGVDFKEGKSKLKARQVPRLNSHQLKHQICLAHTKKNVIKNLSKIGNKAPPDIVRKIREIADSNFYPSYLKDIETLVKDKRVHKIAELHRLLFGELWDKYDKYSLFHQGKGIPTTNNRAERTIGRTKIRYKLCRGLKSFSGAVNFILTTQAFEAKKFEELAVAIA